MSGGLLGDSWDGLKGLAKKVTDPVTSRFAPIGIEAALDELDDDGPTAALLRAMSFVVPGAWENPRDLDTFVREAAPDADPAVHQQIRDRALSLFAPLSSRYRRALAIYSSADLVDRAGAASSLAMRIGDRFLILGALEKLTIRSQFVQAIDAGVKLVAEILAFSQLHGDVPVSPDGVRALFENMSEHAREDRLRLATWVVVDGVLPMGPNFVQHSIDALRGAGAAGLARSIVFGRVAEFFPGEDADAKKNYVGTALDSARDWVDGFVAEHKLTSFGAADRVRQVIDVSESGFEVVAAAADAIVSYYRHTGTQTVARAVTRAAI